jgi:hypothetical protein
VPGTDQSASEPVEKLEFMMTATKFKRRPPLHHRWPHGVARKAQRFISKANTQRSILQRARGELQGRIRVGDVTRELDAQDTAEFGRKGEENSDCHC